MGYAELGAKVKAKYPGQYDDLANDELGKLTLAKYPEYSDIVGQDGSIEEARLHKLKSIFPKTEVEKGGTSPSDIALSTIEGTGRDLTAIPAAFANQKLANIPRMLTQTAGFKYPAPKLMEQEGQSDSTVTSPAAGWASKAAGTAGMLTSPIYKALVPAEGVKAGYGATALSGAAMGGVTAQDDIKETLNPMNALMRATMGAVTAGGMKAGGDIGTKVIPGALKKGAESLLESTMGHIDRYTKFGAKPARGLLEENIASGGSPEEIQFKTQNRLEELRQAKEALLADPAHGNRLVDASDLYEPIDSALAEANTAPDINSALITKLQKARIDVDRMVGGRDISKLSLAEADALKQRVGKLSKFSGNALDKEYQTFDKVANSLYGNLNSKIHEVSPELAEINSRQQDLIPAEKALNRGDMLAGKTGRVANFLRTRAPLWTGLGSAGAFFSGHPGLALEGVKGIAAEEGLAALSGNTAIRSKLASGMYKAGTGMEDMGSTIASKLQSLLGIKSAPGIPPTKAVMAPPRADMGPYGAGPMASIPPGAAISGGPEIQARPANTDLGKLFGATAAAVGGSALGGEAEASQGKKVTGQASTYGWGEKLNKHTANGEVFDKNAMTGASYEFPLGSKVRVTDNKTGKSVEIKINDLGPNKRLGRKIDLSQGAWKKLGIKDPGLADVTVEQI